MAPKFRKAVRKARRDQSEISPLIKYLMFGFNIIFWILGFLIAAIGVYAWVEKETFQNFGRLTMGGALFFDPALLFILVGVTMFFIGFAGCLGTQAECALRENTCLLLFFSFALAIIFFAQLAFGTLIFIYRDKVKNEAEKQLLVMITSYRDDPDLQNMIDWIQRDWLHCCGVNSYRNWESNVYFNCSSKTVGSVEACGVPSSCCRPDYFHIEDAIKILKVQHLTFDASPFNTTLCIVQDTLDINIHKKDTSSASDHVENRVCPNTDENGIVVEEPKVG
ncbi:unnamed protein product [Didymodactylos carnosus]|uniref:Tetraspanin n=1 Tax=Didymodactylos carnosus TaxID=1234261 RepID=A0A8S2EYZ0_9BILA|nr:unnamed protein product [Didymodactylos carnosus]CAF4116176.1 unnamed protein product [Didymodactylos carnosus]